VAPAEQGWPDDIQQVLQAGQAGGIGADVFEVAELPARLEHPAGLAQLLAGERTEGSGQRP